MTPLVTIPSLGLIYQYKKRGSRRPEPVLAPDDRIEIVELESDDDEIIELTGEEDGGNGGE